MEPIAHNTIPSGIEPVDKLLGGLEKGQLYLVHGEASGKSLFGIQFLVEGLKRGDNGALVTRYSPEDAVRRFARLGYDCLEDIHSGRLLILEYSDEIIQQMARLREITPVLRELEWLLGETRPQRLIFDPVTNLVVSQTGELEPRAREFTEWAKSFGATVLLVANGDSDDVIKAFNPLVEESFRFGVKETAERAVRYIAFEKTSFVPDQPVEVDPTRGIFLLGRTQARPTARDTSPLDKSQSADDYKAAPQKPGADLLDLTIELDLPEAPESTASESTASESTASDDLFALDQNLQTPLHLDADAPLEGEDESSENADSQQGASEHLRSAQASRAPVDILSDLIAEIESEESPLDLDELEIEAGAREVESEASQQTPPAQEPVIDSTVTARAVELLLRPPDIKTASPTAQAPASEAASSTAQAAGSASAAIDPKNFKVLVIDNDAASCDAIKQTLGEYTVETVRDAVSGVIKLMSLKPDLVILDVELPIIDGFELLKKIRSSLDLPMIVISSSHLRANDRILSTELGADYYLTRPFSATELRQKARQLIARYRGISSWIVNPFAAQGSQAPVENKDRKEINSNRSPDDAANQTASVRFVSYDEFASQVEANVKTAIDNGSSFSVVGCRLPEMTASGGRPALKLFELVGSLVRDTDLISTNPRNDIVILLADADVAGAQAFINRLRERVIEEIEQEPAIWMRSFPDLEEAYSSTQQDHSPIGNSEPGRRTGDNGPNRRSKKEPNPASKPAFRRRAPRSASAVTMSSEYSKRRDPRASYIDFLEHL